MTGNAKSEALEPRELASDDLDAVSGGFPLPLIAFTFFSMLQGGGAGHHHAHHEGSGHTR